MSQQQCRKIGQASQLDIQTEEKPARCKLINPYSSFVWLQVNLWCKVYCTQSCAW